jgi:hypothetical protein
MPTQKNTLEETAGKANCCGKCEASASASAQHALRRGTHSYASSNTVSQPLAVAEHRRPS